MSDEKLSASELLRLACIFAESDQMEFLRCIARTDDEKEKAKTRSFLKQLRRYRKRRWDC